MGDWVRMSVCVDVLAIFSSAWRQEYEVVDVDVCSEEIDLSRSFGYERLKNAQLELWGCVTPCAIFGRVWQEMNILRLRVMLSHVMISKSCLRLVIVVRFLPICHFRSSIVFYLICVGLCSLVRAVHCVGYCLGRRCDM